eukprot:CAMPEP_0172688144 /NCGR_PEP_ID=MMETSP1074-20121228/22218_1 /TAXON_ID=2916 /ORGANISM="Ceratium fusus, Strain PA161109" /LENGTH=320 /DNA_ID=CAMNT_0013507741 /DNA_START=36 /DNA_END=995 /DNA_ORIENTATION=-
MRVAGVLQRHGASSSGGLLGRGVAAALEWKQCGASELCGACGGQQQRRPFSTDGPFRYIKPKFVERKKHFNEVLIFGDRRKLLDTAQDVLNDRGREFPRAFWEILAKRCIQSLHLFNALELAIIARAFDAHSVVLKRPDLDIYGSIASSVLQLQGRHPGVANVVLADVLSRRLPVYKLSLLQDILRKLGRQAADSMWELSASHAVRLLQILTEAAVQDPALCSRIGGKLLAQLRNNPSPHEAAPLMHPEELGNAAAAFAGQNQRNLELLRELELHTRGTVAAPLVLESLAKLGIDVLPDEPPDLPLEQQAFLGEQRGQQS